MDHLRPILENLSLRIEKPCPNTTAEARSSSSRTYLLILYKSDAIEIFIVN